MSAASDGAEKSPPEDTVEPVAPAVAKRSLGQRFDGWLFDSMPAERVATLRLLVFTFGVTYLLVRTRNLTDFLKFTGDAFEPVGPVSLLASPLPASVVMAIFIATVVAGVAATVGFKFRFTAPIYALGLLWVTSYRNSWGMIFHTENLLVMHTLILAFAPAADIWSVDARRAGAALEPSRKSRKAGGLYGWPVRAMCIVTALAYLIAGVAKLEHAGLQWAFGEELRIHIAFDAVRKIELGSVHSPFAQHLVPYAWLFMPLAWLTLAFELGAPLALIWPRVGRIWCVVAWGFHVGVLSLMAIVFLYPLLGIAFASFYAVERPAQRIAQRISTWTNKRSATSDPARSP